MTFFHRCRTCVFAASDCVVRDKLKASLAGLGVTSVKHRCALYAPVYTPGAPVLVETVAWMSRDGNGDAEGDPPMAWYPGHFIRFVKTSVVAFIKPSAEPLKWIGPHPYAFETRGGGFVKVPLHRVKPADWAPPVDTAECRNCGAMPGVGQPCARDVPYHPLAKCLKHLTDATAAPAPEPDPVAEEYPW